MPGRRVHVKLHCPDCNNGAGRDVYVPWNAEDGQDDPEKLTVIYSTLHDIAVHLPDLCRNGAA